MSTKTKPEGTAATAVETKNISLHSVSAKSNFGQFAYTVEVKVSDEQLRKLASEGLLHITQRAPASRVEKAIAGYEKRPSKESGWTRSSIEYSEAIADNFSKLMATEVEVETEDNIVLKGVNLTTSKYDGGAARPVAYAEAKKIAEAAARHGANALAKLAENVGFVGTATIDNVEFLQAIDEERKRRAAAMFS